MRYTVAWQPAAEAELAELFMSAADKPAIAAAANEIDSRLKLPRDRPHWRYDLRVEA
jgi:hypothetical protein